MTERRIPKNAVEPLIEYCNKLGKKSGRLAADIFEEYLRLMRKYEDYFFSEHWSEKPDANPDFSDEEWKFIESGTNFAEKSERFTVVCLRRNISMKGFKLESFDGEFEYYGKIACFGCVVPDVTWLRKQTKRVEQARREVEEEMKSGNPSVLTKELFVYQNKAGTIRREKMQLVELRFLEELGDVGDRSCLMGHTHRYRCPYGDESEQLIRDGRLAQFIWKLVDWYDYHWNGSPYSTPCPSDMKWYHFDEPSIIDVTSYDDICEALGDGRMKRILKEYERYEKETRTESGKE